MYQTAKGRCSQTGAPPSLPRWTQRLASMAAAAFAQSYSPTTQGRGGLGRLPNCKLSGKHCSNGGQQNPPAARRGHPTADGGTAKTPPGGRLPALPVIATWKSLPLSRAATYNLTLFNPTLHSSRPSAVGRAGSGMIGETSIDESCVGLSVPRRKYMTSPTRHISEPIS